MDTINVITLEDNEDYVIIDEIYFNNTKYIYLTNKNVPEKWCIRKINIIDNNEMLVGLETDDEFDKALIEFQKKNHN